MTERYTASEKELLKLVKSKGVLIETVQLEIGDSFSNYEPRKIHKRSLGAIPIKSFFKKYIKAVYTIYEDFDGSIKYYIYKNPTNKMRKNMLKRK